jgi:hypothetical protein
VVTYLTREGKGVEKVPKLAQIRAIVTPISLSRLDSAINGGTAFNLCAYKTCRNDKDYFMKVQRSKWNLKNTLSHFSQSSTPVTWQYTVRTI